MKPPRVRNGMILVNFRLSEKEFEQLDMLAKKNFRSRAQECRRAVIHDMDKQVRISKRLLKEEARLQTLIKESIKLEE